MSRVSTAAAGLSAVLCLLIALSGILPMASSQTSSSNSQATSSGTTAKNGQSESGAPSASDIAAAKASGKVWVNLDSGVYHRGGRWYGKTKNGKFMTVDEAKKAGYKAAKRD
jgi:hypothetical protein